MVDDVLSPSKWRQHFTLDLPDVSQGSVWIHACSVGEVSSISALLFRLLKQGHDVHLTVVTRTGFAHAKRLFADNITLSWLPWDLPWLMQRWVAHMQPSVLLLCETEFWPGMLKACHQRHIPIVGVNTRISDRSFPKYAATRWLWKPVLGRVDLFLAQSELDVERLRHMGVTASKVKTVGNLKFAVQAPDVDANQVRRFVDPSGVRPILVVASTHDGEEAQIVSMLQAWRRVCPDLLTLIVPRHPERFDDVANILRQQGVSFTRYAQTRLGDEAVVLVDAMGVLTGLYTVADVVFIGGSLAKIGGHNPLEAAVCGRGVLTGPHLQNFRVVMQSMQQEQAAIVVRNAEELQLAVSRLLQKPDELKQLHAHAALFMHHQNKVLDDMWLEMVPFF